VAGSEPKLRKGEWEFWFYMCDVMGGAPMIHVKRASEYCKEFERRKAGRVLYDYLLRRIQAVRISQAQTGSFDTSLLFIAISKTNIIYPNT